MMKKTTITAISLILFIFLTGCNLTMPEIETQVNAQETKAHDNVQNVKQPDVVSVPDVQAEEPQAEAAQTTTETNVAAENNNNAIIEIEKPEPVPLTPAMHVIFEEMTLVQLVSEVDGWAKTECAGNGLNNVTPAADDAMVLIPNAGDLTIDGANVAIELGPTGEMTFIPRVPGQIIYIPVDLDVAFAGQEVLSLDLDEAIQLMAIDRLTWTAREQGPNGNGHGIAGHIAACDPQFKG